MIILKMVVDYLIQQAIKLGMAKVRQTVEAKKTNKAVTTSDAPIECDKCKKCTPRHKCLTCIENQLTKQLTKQSTKQPANKKD